jgi:Rho GTPase-activating protein 39
VHIDDETDDEVASLPASSSAPSLGRVHRVYSTVLHVSPVLFVANSAQSVPASSSDSPSRATYDSDAPSTAPPAPRPTLQRSLTERPRGMSRDVPVKPHPFPRPPELPMTLVEEINLFQLEGFGKKYFRTAKKGLFRRLIPVRQLLKWSREPPASSLLRLHKRVRKLAPLLFRLVQTYMGDRDPQALLFERLARAQELIEKCVTMAELRDEAYCIIAKQTCHNPNYDSNLRGWELLSLIAQSFPPTNDLEMWLRSYIKESVKLAASKKDDKLLKYTSFCLRKLESVCREGGRGILLDVVEIERAIQFPIRPPIFGGTLAEIMSYQADKPHLKVPIVCSALVTLLDKLNAEIVEGIFRLPGSASGISKLRILIENQNYNFTETDPHVPASSLKIWLRMLEDPIIPDALYAKCVDAARAEDPIKCCDIVQKELPEPNRSIALYLTKWLQRLSLPDNQKLNKMGVANFAIMFGPCFMRTPGGDPSFLLEAARYEQGFVSHLLKNMDTSSAPSE